ncbi:hypothetical protein H7K43_30415 [Streptomyces sp. TYQ1024]|nr:hypothetical protein [Streptomyces sp. TYQ1024]
MAADLVRRATDAQRLRAAVAQMPGAAHRRVAFVHACENNTRALKALVGRHGWPTPALVGDEASVAALQIFLHAHDTRDLPFKVHCKNLIAAAVAKGQCSPIIGAYVEDHVAVALGQPQPFGTRINGALRRPYPIRDTQQVDARRAEAGLPPLAEALAAVLATTAP